MDTILNKAQAVKGEITVSADKSISHRTLILAALAQGESQIRNLLKAEDTNSTASCLGQLGISIKHKEDFLIVEGKGLRGMEEPESVLDCGNSGTTMRLLSGLLSGQNFFSILIGDESLSRRPMSRVIEPLRLMGAEITGRKNSKYAPLAIKGTRLQGIINKPAVASAQVKSALLLAGLTAEGDTTIIEKIPTRDHSERMLAAMGANLSADNGEIKLCPGTELTPQEFMVPGDISSAAFFLVLATIVPGSQLLIQDVGINPTRDGILEALGMMGANIKIENKRVFGGEVVADIMVSSTELKGITIEGNMIPRLIDELPVLAVAMAAAQGNSIVKNAEELRVKETDRISAIANELGKMGVNIVEQADGFIITGNRDNLRGAAVNSRGDHRIAMSLAVAAQICDGETRINDSQVVNISFPEFWNLLARVTGTNKGICSL